LGVRHSLRDEPAVMGACEATCVGTITVVEAEATVAGTTHSPRSIAPAPNDTLAILRDFIVTLRKEPALDPVGASFHTSTDPRFQQAQIVQLDTARGLT